MIPRKTGVTTTRDEPRLSIAQATLLGKMENIPGDSDYGIIVPQILLRIQTIYA